jgi:putative transposase
MARLPRLSMPDVPHHIILWGHNHQPIVIDDEDRQQWLALLRDGAVTERVDVHGWALLSQHLHLLITPRTASGLARFMQALSRRYSAAFNRRHGRQGTLWEGRYRCGLVQPSGVLLDVLLFIETHPWRSGEVEQVADPSWSSLDHHLGRRRDPLIHDGMPWWALGNTPFERELAWAKRLHEGLPADDLQRIAQRARRGWPHGDPGFLDLVTQTTGLSAQPRPRGRPRLTESGLAPE